MRAAVAGTALLLHRLPGRIRLHLPGETGFRQRGLAELRRLPGVLRVQDNPWTNNLLVHFDPQITNENTLLSRLLATAEEPEAPASQPLALPLLPARLAEVSSSQPVQAELVRSATRTASAALGLGLLAAGRLPGVKGVALAARFLTLAQHCSWIREALCDFLGRSAADHFFRVANIVHAILSSSPLSLAMASLETLRLLLELLARPAVPLGYEHSLGMAA